MSTNRLEMLLTGDASSLKAALAEAGSAAQKTMSDIAAHSQGATAALAAVGAAGAGLVKSFVDAERPLEVTEAKMLTVEKSAAAVQAQIEKLKNFQSQNQIFDLQTLEKASMKLKNLTGDGNALLPMAAALAAQFGELETKAGTLGKAWEGNEKGMKALNKEAQITNKELIAAGAHVDATSGKITAKGVVALEAYRAAFSKVIETKYGDAVKNQSDTMVGAFAALSNAIHDVEATFGKQFAPTIKAVANSLTGLVESFRAMPDSMKNIVSVGAAVTAVVGTIGLAVLRTIAALGPAAMAWQAYTAKLAMNAAANTALATSMAEVTAMEVALGAQTTVLGAEMGALGAATGEMAVAATASSFAFGPVGIVLGIVGIALAAVAGSSGSATGATRELTAAFQGEEKAIIAVTDALKKHGAAKGAAITDSAEAFKSMGLTNVEATKALIGELGKLEQAENDATARYTELLQAQDGGTAQEIFQAKVAHEAAEQKVKDLEKIVEILRGTKVALDGTADAQAKASAAAKAATDDQVKSATKMFEDFKRNKSAGVFLDAKEELAAMEEVMSGLRKVATGSREFTQELEKLELESKAVRHRARELNLKHELDAIKQMAAEGRLSKEEEAAELRKLGDRYTDLAEKRIALTLEATGLEKKGAEETIAVQVKALDVHKNAIDARISAMEVELARGGDLKKQEAALTAAIQERAKIQEDIIRKQLAGDILKDPSHRAQLEKTADEAILTSRAALGEALKKLGENVHAVEAHRIQARITANEAAKKSTDAEIDSLKERGKAGEDVDAALIKEIKHRRDLELAMIAQRRAQIALTVKDKDEQKEAYKGNDAERAAAKTKADKDDAEVERNADVRRKKGAADNAALDEKIAQARVDAMKSEQALGAKMDGSYLEAVKQRQAAEEEALRTKAQAAESGKNAAEVARIEKQLKYDLLSLTKAHREEEAKVKDEIEAQTKALKDQHSSEMSGKTMSMQEAFGGSDSFSLDAPKGGGIARFANDEKINRQRAIDSEYRRGLESLREDGGQAGAGAKTLGPTERREMNDRMRTEREAERTAQAEAMKGLGPTERREAQEHLDAARGPAGGSGGSESDRDVLLQILDAIKQPVQVSMKGGRPATEDTPWHQRLNS